VHLSGLGGFFVDCLRMCLGFEGRDLHVAFAVTLVLFKESVESFTTKSRITCLAAPSHSYETGSVHRERVSSPSR
jgi:hypothetical protein